MMSETSGPWRSGRLRVMLSLHRRPVLYGLAWAAAAIGTLICVFAAWIAMRDTERSDGNRGHAAIDFSGQWLGGRLPGLGQGRRLYARAQQRATLREAYPREDESPTQEESDVEAIMAAMMGDDGSPGGASARHVGGPLYPPIDAFVYAPLAFLSPRVAYRLAQLASIGMLFVAGGAIAILSRGRGLLTVAALWLTLF